MTISARACYAHRLRPPAGAVVTNYGTEQGLPDRDVHDLVESRDGGYWIATANGLCRFEPQSSRMRRNRFTPHRLAGDQRSNYVNALLEDKDGRLWCGGDGGLFRLDRTVDLPAGGKPAPLRITALLQDRSGALWVASHGGLHRIRADRVEHYAEPYGITPPVLSLVEDHEGVLWAGTEHGLCRLVADPHPGSSVVAQRFTRKDGLPDDYVQSLLRGPARHLWLGTLNGIASFTIGPGQPVFHVRGRGHGLKSASAEALAEDREGNLWIGTDGGGASRIARAGLSTYTASDGLGPGSVVAIFENRQGELCVASRSRGALFLSRFNGERFVPLPNLPRSFTDFGWGWSQLVTQDRSGAWWIATGAGLLRLRAPDFSRTVLLDSENIFRLYEDSRGDVWISISSGIRHRLIRWDRASQSFRSYYEAEGLPPLDREQAAAFCEDRAGNVWVGFLDGGLGRFRNGRFTQLSPAEGAPTAGVRALHLDNAGRLWVCSTRSGISRVDDPAAQRPVFTRLHGLTSNMVQAIAQDRWGRVYLGTGAGVERLDPATGRVKRYTTADGLAGGEVQVAFCDRSGALWFGTQEGISRLVPEPDSLYATLIWDRRPLLSAPRRSSVVRFSRLRIRYHEV